MARSSGTGSARSPRPRPKSPDRAAWEKALTAATELPVKERRAVNDLTSEFLPRFIETLRSKGYAQKGIIAEVQGLGFGVSASQVRAVDKSLRTQQSPPSPPAPPAQNGSPPEPPATTRGARPPWKHP